MTLAIRRDRPDLALIARTELERRHAVASRQLRLSQTKPDEAEIFARHWAAINDMAGAEAPNFIARHFRCPPGEIRWWHLCPEDIEVDTFQRQALQELRRATIAAVFRHEAAIGPKDGAETKTRAQGLLALDRELAVPVLGPIHFPPANKLKEAA